MNPADISLWQLGLCLVLVFVLGVVSLIMRLGLARDMLVATVRTVLQLLLLGYVLIGIFQIRDAWLITLLLLGMIAFAAWTVTGRVGQKRLPVFPPVFFTMAISYIVLTYFATGIVLQVEPWYAPQYVIPIGGMLIGNSMNAIAVSLERLLSALERDRARVELVLSLGGTAREAAAPALRDAIRAGMIPTITSMLTVGIVSIPGMMTGQILAGADPLLSVRYQIMIMLMILLATGVGSMLATSLVMRRCFNKNHQLTYRG